MFIRENIVYPQIPYDKLGINTYLGKMEYIWFETNTEGYIIDCQNNIFFINVWLYKKPFLAVIKVHAWDLVFGALLL